MVDLKKRKKFRKLMHLLLAAIMFITVPLGLSAVMDAKEVNEDNATLDDLWNGNAHFELYVNRPMGGQAASGSNVVIVGDNWYWFHRVVVDVESWKLGTVCEKSTDKGLTWSEPVTVLEPTTGTAWSRMITDGSFYYDSVNNKWIALMQTNNGNEWTMSYFEREGSDPMGLFSTPPGFSNPGCSAKEIWSQLTTSAGRDCVDIPGGTNLIFDEGTPQIVEKVGNTYYVTFHGASSTNGTTQGYRGIASTTDFQNWTALGGDCIVDQYDALKWNVDWNPGGPIGVGAANIIKEGSYYYQIIEGVDINLNGMAGQNWPMGLMRSTSLTSTNWDSWGNSPLFPSTGQVVEWQYPTFFKDADGVTYCAITKYAPDTESGFRIYKLVSGSGVTTPAPTTDNIVLIPSFEWNGTEGKEWSVGSMSISTDQAHTGTHSLKSTLNGVNAITSTDIYVQPYTYYHLSGWVYKTNSNGRAYLDMNDIEGEVQPTLLNGSGGETWIKIGLDWYSGTNTSIKIRCVTDSGIDAPVYFDDISLVKIGNRTGKILFSSQFESGGTLPTWSDSVESILNVNGYLSGINPECSIREEEKHRSGSSAIMFSGTDESTTNSYCQYKVFDVDIPITSTTKLSYWAYPQNENARHVIVDLVCTDGTILRETGATDYEGIRMHPTVARGIVNTWRQVQCNVGQWMNGKTIDRILISYDQGPATGQYKGYIDDIYITN